MGLTRHAAVLAVPLVALAASSEAAPFSVIVPSAITLNTSGSYGVSGGGFGGWLLTTTQPIDIEASRSFGVLYRTAAVSSVPSVSADLLLIAFPTGRVLMPGEAIDPGSHQMAGREQFVAQLMPGEQTVPLGDVGLYFVSAFRWPNAGYAGTARFDFVFALGQDVARYSLLATFGPALPGAPAVTITAAQRVNSLFDPSFRAYVPSLPPDPQPIPEPSTWLLVAGGLALLRRWRPKL